MFSPEFVSLWLMIGLGVSMAITPTKNKEFLPYRDWAKNLVFVLLGFPVGFVLSAFILLFWPTYVTALVLKRLK